MISSPEARWVGGKLAFTQYYHHRYWMVYGSKRGGAVGGAYIAHWSCNRIAIGQAWHVGERQEKED